MAYSRRGRPQPDTVFATNVSGMDSDHHYEHTRSDDEPLRDAHPTPLFSVRRVRWTAARRLRRWLRARVVLTGPYILGKSLEDVALALADENEEDLAPCAGSLRLRARFEAERLATMARRRMGTLRPRGRRFVKTVGEALRDILSGGDQE